MSALIGVDTLIMTVVILLLAASWRLNQKRKYYRNVTTKLPTIFGIPFIGIVHMMLNVNKVYQKIGKVFDNLKASTCCIWVATTPYVLTVDPEVIKHITSSPEFLNKSKDLYTHFQNGVFSGLLVSPVTIMDMKLEESSETYTEIVEAFNVFIDHMEKDLLCSWLGLGFLSRTPQYNRILKYIRDLMRSLTKKHLAQQIESEAMNNFVENKQAMIDITIKALRQGIFNENQVDIEGFTMLAASYETSVGATYTCLLMLAMHPEIQERVFQEIRSVFPDGITSVEYDDMKKLPYLDMFISEALRIAPPGPYIGRQTVDDTELYRGVILPKDAQVLIPIYELHRRKELWGPEASHFNPDNFLPENIAKRHPYSYMPFSKGSRNCIGFRYAEISIRIILIHAVRNLKFSTTFKYEDIVYVPRVTLGYKIQPPVSIEARAN
ncbi:probable cytochrome P450 313a4 isoform X2 [Bactrocera oleae]|uniref:probable cytochrome P450 313a4 isoform X2 n=1 Tax=Bactrocera oleae TaxID=104688 RepID=UPI00387EC89B